MPAKIRATRRPSPTQARRALLLMDKRTTLGEFAATVRGQLIHDQGGDDLPMARSLLVDLATWHAVMLARAVAPLKDGGELDCDRQQDAVIYGKELRATLLALGLDRAVKDKAPALAKYVEGSAE